VRDTERPFLATIHREPHDMLCDGHLDVWDRDRRPRSAFTGATRLHGTGVHCRSAPTVRGPV